MRVAVGTGCTFRNCHGLPDLSGNYYKMLGYNIRDPGKRKSYNNYENILKDSQNWNDLECV